MPADFLILGLGQLTESLIPSLQVKLNSYQLSWEECLSQGLQIILEIPERLDYTRFANRLDYSYGETIMDHFDEMEANGMGEAWRMFEDASEAFLQLSWFYYEHFYTLLWERLGPHAGRLDSLYVHQHLERSNDVCIAFHWSGSDPEVLRPYARYMGPSTYINT